MSNQNLLTLAQAVAEDTSGYVVENGATLTTDPTLFEQGQASLKVVTPGVIGFEGMAVRFPATGGLLTSTVYVYSVWVFAPSGQAMMITAQERGSPFTTYGSATFTGTGAWQRVYTAFTTPSSWTDDVDLKVIINGTAAVTYWVDALQLELGSTPTAFTVPFADTPNYSPGTGQVILQGQDITDYVDEETINIQLVLAQGNGVGAGGASGQTQATADVYLGPAATAIGAGSTPSGTDLVRRGEVKVYDNATRQVFGGYCTKLDDITDSINVKTTLTCDDYWGALDRVQVFKLYTGTGDVSIIKDLLTTYAPWVDQSLLPATDNYVYTKFAAKGSLKEVIQKLADNQGWGVWIDSAKVMYYVSLANAQTAPFGVSDDPDYLTTFPHAITKYEQDDTAIVNRCYFYGGANVSPDFTQDLSVQANGSNKYFSLLYFPHESSDNKIHVYKNGVELTMYSVFDTDPSHALKSAGGTADVLIDKDSEVLIFDVAPTAGVPLTIVYRYNIPLIVVMQNQASHDFFGAWYDARISDTNVFDVNTAMARCRSLLAEQAFGLETVEFLTWTPGLFPGQTVHITNALRGIDQTFLIQQVTVTSLGGGFFQYDVVAGAWNWSILDVIAQAARILNPTTDLTEADLSIITAQQVDETGHASVTVTTKTATSGAYYSRTTALGDTHDAYSGFFTITS